MRKLKTPGSARLHKILSKDGMSVISSIQLENEDYTTERDRPWNNYSGSTSLARKQSWNLLEAETVLNWNSRKGNDPVGTGRFPGGSLFLKVEMGCFLISTLQIPRHGWNNAHHATAGL